MGASLWLLPPAGSEIESSLSTLINTTIPSLLPNIALPKFSPHITLTSDVPSGLDPSTVTASIAVNSIPDIKFKEVNVGKTFFTRVTLYLEKTDAVKTLAAECRKMYVTNGDGAQAQKWAEESYVPHLSLVYAEDVPDADVVTKIEEAVAKAGIVFDVGVWRGGRIVLVDCSKPIEQWAISGERVL